MTTCFVWLVATTALAYEPLVAGLIKEGYQVGSLSPTGEPYLPGELSCLISLRVSKGIIEGTPKVTVIDLVTKILEARQLTFHGIVVTGGSADGVWTSSNIVLPGKEPQTALERITTQDLFESGGI